jgi:hypothetical protein
VLPLLLQLLPLHVNQTKMLVMMAMVRMSVV